MKSAEYELWQAKRYLKKGTKRLNEMLRLGMNKVKCDKKRLAILKWEQKIIRLRKEDMEQDLQCRLKNKEISSVDRDQIRRPDKFHGPDEEFTENPIQEETISFEQLIRKCK